MSKAKVGTLVSFAKADDEQQIVWGEVYVPWTGEGAPPKADRDTHGNWARPEEIQKMAYEFMRKQRINKIDKNHDEKVTGDYIVESFIAREGDPDFTPGAWVVGTKIVKAATWTQIKKGEITGYSIGGTALIIPDAEEGGEQDEQK